MARWGGVRGFCLCSGVQPTSWEEEDAVAVCGREETACPGAECSLGFSERERESHSSTHTHTGLKPRWTTATLTTETLLEAQVQEASPGSFVTKKCEEVLLLFIFLTIVCFFFGT